MALEVGFLELMVGVDGVSPDVEALREGKPFEASQEFVDKLVQFLLVSSLSKVDFNIIHSDGACWLLSMFNYPSLQDSCFPHTDCRPPWPSY